MTTRHETKFTSRPVEVSYSDGRTETYDSYADAIDSLASGSDVVIGHDGDLTDGGDRTLVWLDEESSINDDGANAIASIRWA